MKKIFENNVSRKILFVVVTIMFTIGLTGFVSVSTLADEVPTTEVNVTSVNNMIETQSHMIDNIKEVEISTGHETTEVTKDIYKDKNKNYKSLYGPKATVTVNGHTYDLIPGAPYSVYEAMAAAEDQVTTETIEYTEPEYYSENVTDVETTTITATESTTESAPEAESTSEAAYTSNDLYYNGVIYWNNHKWTWYSEKVLPGGGLNIPGRYTDSDGFVCDENGYICLAADHSYIAPGTVIDTPFGRPGKLYDTGCAYGTVDVYVGY